MDFNANDLDLMVNQENKPLYDTMYDLIVVEFENALKHTDLIDLTEDKQKILGTCGIYISSMVELLHMLREMMARGYVESGGAIATSCWERSITLRKIMIDPQNNAQIHTDHQKAKSTPWSIWQMVNDVLAHERELKNNSPRPHEVKNFYIQYTFLSSIKHGNPYTISYLYRPGYSSDEKLFRLKSNDSFEDKDLKTYVKMLAADNALDALIDYSKIFRTRYDSLLDLRRNIDGLFGQIELHVPVVMQTTPDEMGQEYWEYLIRLEKQRRF